MNSQSCLKRLLSGAFSLLFAAATHASVIDFEGVALPGQQLGVGNNYMENGFNFFNPGLPNDAAIIGSGTQNTTGSNYYTWNSPLANNPITMSVIGGGLFSLSSLDVGSKTLGTPATFSITGYLFGGGTVLHSVTGEDNFVGVSLGWSNLTHVEFAYGSGNFGAIDNLDVNINVPDSGSTIALLGSVLIGFAAWRRRFVR